MQSPSGHLSNQLSRCSEDNWKAQTMNDLNGIFGMRFPVEIVNETSPANVASMDRFVAPLAFTSNVAKSNSHPTINGVQQMWYPTNMHCECFDKPVPFHTPHSNPLTLWSTRRQRRRDCTALSHSWWS